MFISFQNKANAKDNRSERFQSLRLGAVLLGGRSHMTQLDLAKDLRSARLSAV